MEPFLNYQEEYEKYKERLLVALKASRTCIFEVDLTKQLYCFFENSEDIFGVSGKKILADVEPFSRLSPEEYEAAAKQYFSHPDDTEIIGISLYPQDGTTFWPLFDQADTLLYQAKRTKNTYIISQS